MQRVLLVEESKTLSYILGKSLRRAEFQPKECTSFSEALAYLSLPDNIGQIDGV